MQSGHAPAYVARAAHYMAEYGIDVVDVGVASNKFPAVTTAEVARYKQLADAQNRTAVRAFLNACGSTYGEPVNGWLDDGTPVINSVCQGPPATDDTDGHFIYYYRDHLNKTDEALDLGDELGQRARAALAAHARDDAEGAGHVAAVLDLQEGARVPCELRDPGRAAELLRVDLFA